MDELTMSQFASKDDLLTAQAARIAELADALEAAREDAGRYRWLRDLPMDAKETDWLWSYQGDALDAAIDTAIDQARGKGVADGA